jgi:hypothetical protein
MSFGWEVHEWKGEQYEMKDKFDQRIQNRTLVGNNVPQKP